MSPRHRRNTRPDQHIQQRGIQGLASISTRGVTQTLEEYKAWPAFFSRGVTQTVEEYKAWPAYAAEVSPRHWGNTRPGQVSPRRWRNTRPGQHIQQRSHADIRGIQGLASISSRNAIQTLEEYKAWPEYQAEASPRHWRNTMPGQHIQQRCHPDIAGIPGLASISSRCFTQTSEIYKACRRFVKLS